MLIQVVQRLDWLAGRSKGAQIMAEAFRVTIGNEPKYLPATEEKPAVAYARVVENQRVFEPETKQYIDLDPVWREGVFRGAAADSLVRDYQVGDPLVVAGTSKTEASHKDGKFYTNEKLYVDSFGPDAMFRTIAIERSRSQSASQNATQVAEQSQQQQTQAASSDAGSSSPGSRMHEAMTAKPTQAVGFAREQPLTEATPPQQNYAM